jgi:uncharacterized protein involved in outer membrane biogenesis
MTHGRPGRISFSRGILLLLPVLLLALWLLWDWNWFRPLVERQASSALGRMVTLQHFDVELSRRPLIRADGIVIANPDEFPADSRFGSVDSLAIRLDAWRMLRGEILLHEIDVRRPVGDLRPGPSGEPNWKFAFPKDDRDEPGKPVQIGRLRISDGRIQVLEPAFKADFVLDIRTEEIVGAEPRIRVDIDGRYAGEPITGRFIGGSVLNLRETGQPYPVDLEAANGPTQVSLKGSLQNPLAFAGARLKLLLKGPSLDALYPLTGVPLPATAPYQLQGQLDYSQQRVRFRDFSGVVGGSDLSGDLAADLSGTKRLVVANLMSKKVLLADLAGFIGAAPGKGDVAGETAEQRRQRAKENASARVIPDTPINLPKIRAADLDIRYRGQRIESGDVPLDEVEAHLIVKDGMLSLKPLNFRVGDGRIVSNIALDGRQERVHALADIDFRRLDLKRLMRDAGAFEGTGRIGGAARIDTHGNSLAEMLGQGDGELKLFMNGGELSALLVNLAGLEFGKALLSLLGLPSETQVRCLISDFELKKGLLQTRTLLLDTGEANVIGKGDINLREETLDYVISTQPKRIGLASLSAPIHVRGTFKEPSIRPDLGTLAARGGAAVALGVFLTPLAALIPTLELGMGEDNDCRAMVQQVRKAATAAPATGARPQ